jgi:hypothetical protein
MNEFEHERLDVYKAAIELLADAASATLPRVRLPSRSAAPRCKLNLMVKKAGSGSGSGSGST